MDKKLPLKCDLGAFKIAVEAGKKYSYCACGATQTHPLCDGSHKAYKNADGTSQMKSIPYFPEENKIVVFCGCRKSKDGIFCDSSQSSCQNSDGGGA